MHLYFYISLCHWPFLVALTCLSGFKWLPGVPLSQLEKFWVFLTGKVFLKNTSLRFVDLRYFNFSFIFEGQFLVNIKSSVDSLFLPVFWICHTLFSGFQGCSWKVSCRSNGKIPVYDRSLLWCCFQNYFFVSDSLTVTYWGLTSLSLSYLEYVQFLGCIDHFHKWSECQDVISPFFSWFFPPGSLIMLVCFTVSCWSVDF